VKFHNSRPRRKPTIRWEDVTGGTHQILGIQGWKRQAEDRAEKRCLLREARAQKEL